MKKFLAEMVGTMVLVLMGCGVAVSLGCDPVNNIPAVVGTAFAFGLAGSSWNSFCLWPGCGSNGLYHWWHLWLPHQSCHYVGLHHRWTHGCQGGYYVYRVPVHWCFHRKCSALHSDG